MTKKMRKSRVSNRFGPSKLCQNPAQNPSKWKFKKTHDFWAHFRQHLSKLQASKPWKYQFRLDGSTIFKVFAKIVFLVFPCIFGPKNLSKTLPKRGLDSLKIYAKNDLFFNYDFLGFWPRFGSPLGLQDGAKLAPKAYFHKGGCSPGALQVPS